MLPDALDVPNDAEDYSFSEEPVPLSPNLAANAARDEFIFLFTSAAVLLAIFMLSVLFAKIAKHLSLWRLLSFLILFASFVPALPHFQYVQSYLLGNMTNEPEATTERIDRAVGVFTTATLWGAPVVLLVGVFLLWRLPWTVAILPLSVSSSYWFFSYWQLDRRLYGTYVTIDGLVHGWFLIGTLLLRVLASGWLWGRSPKKPLPFRAKAFR